MTLRYLSALASMRSLLVSVVFDLTDDDLLFLTRPELWVRTERRNAERCIQAVAYGALDVCGLPRFNLPAEFIAAAIALYVHPVNQQLACAFMEGVSYADEMSGQSERRLKAHDLFAFVVEINGGEMEKVEHMRQALQQKLELGVDV